MDVRCEVRLNGIEEMLNQIGPKLAKSHLRKAMKQSMMLIEADAKARAPVDTGSLRDSITTVTVLNANKESGRASVGPAMTPGLKKSGNDPTQDPGFYGRLVEFGVPKRNIQKQPFLRPSFDAQAENVVAKFAEVLKEGLLEAVK